MEEQRICIKFCYRLGKTTTETYDMLRTAFASDCISRSRAFEWHARFQKGRESTDDDERAGRPTTVRTPDAIARGDAVIRIVSRSLIIRRIRSTLRLQITFCFHCLSLI